jgi:phosphoribosylaminoimidazole (AIR) synthetase
MSAGLLRIYSFGDPHRAFGAHILYFDGLKAVANRGDRAEANRVFNLGMVVYTDRDYLEHALVHRESHNPKPIGEVKERGFVIV